MEGVGRGSAKANDLASSLFDYFGFAARRRGVCSLSPRGATLFLVAIEPAARPFDGLIP